MTFAVVVTRFAWHMALLPLVWLAFEGARGQSRDAAWWWLAGALGVSWLADGATRLILPRPENWIPAIVFPVTQAGLIGAVLFRTRRQAGWFVLILVVAGIIAVLGEGVTKPDVILYTAACLGVLWILYLRPDLPTRLRLCLAVYFGVGWIAWIAHALWINPTVFRVPHATWYAYQSTRLAGLLLFCWAARERTSPLRLVRDD